jgi:hypothetical protein
MTSIFLFRLVLFTFITLCIFMLSWLFPTNRKPKKGSKAKKA